MALTRKIKQCRSALQWIKVRVRSGSWSVSASKWKVWSGSASTRSRSPTPEKCRQFRHNNLFPLPRKACYTSPYHSCSSEWSKKRQTANCRRAKTIMEKTTEKPYVQCDRQLCMCCGSGSGAFLTPGSGIRNRFFRIQDPKTIFFRACWQFFW